MVVVHTENHRCRWEFEWLFVSGCGPVMDCRAVQGLHRPHPVHAGIGYMSSHTYIELVFLIYSTIPTPSAFLERSHRLLVQKKLI